MQWWPLEVNSDQKIYQDYPHPRLAKKSNQGIRPYFSFTLASLNFQSKISFRTFSSLKKKIHACLSLSLFSLKRILSTARFFYFISIFPLALFRLDTSFSYSYHFGNVPSLENCYLTPESASRKSSSNSISAYSEPGIAFVHSEPATPAFVPQAQKQYLYPSVYNDYNHLHRRKSDERYNRLRRKTNKYNREYNQYLLGRQ